MDQTILYGLSYGMYVVGASDAGRPVGCIINTCIQITSDNPVLAVSLNKNNYTLRAVKRSGRFSLSIIAEQTDRNVIPTFGFQCSRECDKYAGFGLQTVRGVPLVNGTFSGRLICEVMQAVDCGTHEVVFARLVDTLPGEQARPMTYEYYHKVVKGKAPKNAPTYRAEEEMSLGAASAASAAASSSSSSSAPVFSSPQSTAEVGQEPETTGAADAVDYVCPVCGYVHKGGMAGEPTDYACPVCGMAGGTFEPKE